MIQRVGLIGLGAVGSVYAAKMQSVDPDLVKVIVDPERYEEYRAHGVMVNQTTYQFNLVTPEMASEPVDLMLVAVKQHHLSTAIRLMRPFIGEETIILSLLNGITSEEILEREFGMDKLLYAFVVGIDATREGRATRFTTYGKVVFGEKQNLTYSPKVQAVKGLFDRTGIPYQIPEDMLRELWWKFMLNVGLNQVSAVLKAPYHVFQTIGEARELMEMACGEVLRIAEKKGIRLTEDDIRGYRQVIAKLSPEGKTSMLQDVEAGRKTEVESFAGTIVALGKEYGVATPVNDCLLRMIRTVEKTYPDRY
ncbi:MAG: ketopantoate reductase family protein [Firmicutes bacterium]|nr:ketopantoate reductase family protein [Bacillota bacterium]